MATARATMVMGTGMVAAMVMETGMAMAMVMVMATGMAMATGTLSLVPCVLKFESGEAISC